jgi:hypothetical protein
MALPALDTSDISFIAWWNAFDHGVSSIDPQDTTGVFAASESYSNGVQGTVEVGFTAQSSRLFNARVKDDGYIIAWLDRSRGTVDTRLSPGGSDYQGPWDILNDWTDDVSDNLTQHNAERVINRLYSSLSNSGSITYNPSDVALYNYEFPDATNFDFVTQGDRNWNGSFTIGSSVTLYRGFLAGAVADSQSETSSLTWEPGDENVEIANVSNGRELGLRDVLELNEISTGEQSTLDHSASGLTASTQGGGTVYIAWS